MAKRKAKKAKSVKFKRIEVGRFDDPEGLKSLVFADGESVRDALNKAGITLAQGEEVNDINGKTLDLSAKLVPGMSLIVTGNFKSG